MTNKELQQLLKPYPDDALIRTRHSPRILIGAIGIVFEHPTLDLTISQSMAEGHDKQLVKEIRL